MMKSNPNSPKMLAAKTDGIGNAPATATQIDAAFIDQLGSKLDTARLLERLTFSFNGQWAELAPRIQGRPCVKVTEFSRSDRPELVSAQPNANFKQYPLLADLTAISLCAESKSNRETGQRYERELFLADFDIFQRLVTPTGEILEQRLELGSGRFSLEEFSENFTLEMPHAVAERTLARLVKEERETRLKYEKAVASIPVPVDADTKLALGIAQGVALALKNLGVVPQQAKA